MKSQNFTTTIVVDQSPEEAFKAINNARGWWSGEIRGDTDKIGAEFDYRYKDVHFSKQKIKELVPGKRVVWHVLESRLGFPKENEWSGTDIVFDISQRQVRRKYVLRTSAWFLHFNAMATAQGHGEYSSTTTCGS
jgi:hypothetical protein